MQAGDRLICAFVKPIKLNKKFKNWFLHITIVPWFRVKVDSDNLAKMLKQSYVGSRPFEVFVGEEAQFGYKKRKTVNLVEAPELLRLEGQTRRLLHSHKAWVVDEADKTRNFRPHVTSLEVGRLHKNDRFKVEKLNIVEQKGDYKEVVAEIELA